MKIEINIETKRLAFLEKKFGQDKVKKTIEKVVEDWLGQLVDTNFRKQKTIEQKLIDLSK